jgi:hypothetical protein
MIEIESMNRIHIVVTENPFLLEQLHANPDGAHFVVLQRQILDITA